MALVVKNPSASAGDIKDAGSIPGSGRSPGEGNGNPLQYSCLENLMDREVWWATVHRVVKSQTRLKRLSMHKRLEYPCLRSSLTSCLTVGIKVYGNLHEVNFSISIHLWPKSVSQAVLSSCWDDFGAPKTLLFRKRKERKRKIAENVPF